MESSKSLMDLGLSIPILGDDLGLNIFKDFSVEDPHFSPWGEVSILKDEILFANISHLLVEKHPIFAEGSFV
jgi:hypothetical protein